MPLCTMITAVRQVDVLYYKTVSVLENILPIIAASWHPICSRLWFLNCLSYVTIAQDLCGMEAYLVQIHDIDHFLRRNCRDSTVDQRTYHHKYTRNVLIMMEFCQDCTQLRGD